jgi:hypothetical protein
VCFEPGRLPNAFEAAAEISFAADVSVDYTRL